MNDPEYFASIQATSEVPCRRHFIYITACRDESKEPQSYYKLTDEDMEEITKECPTKFLVLVEYAELSNPDNHRKSFGHPD
jgi:hypothetical protein